MRFGVSTATNELFPPNISTYWMVASFPACVRLCYLTLLTIYVMYTYNFMACRVFVEALHGSNGECGCSHPHPKMPISCVSNVHVFSLFWISFSVQLGSLVFCLCNFSSGLASAAIMPIASNSIHRHIYYFSLAFYDNDEEHKYANNYFRSRIFFWPHHKYKLEKT